MPSPNRGLLRCATALLATVVATAGAKAQEPASAEQIKQWVSEAWAFQTKGQTAQAIPAFERALEAARGRYGEDAPETAAIMNDAALSLGLAGQFAKAEPLCRQGLAIREAKRGKDHIETAASLHRLGWLYTRMGRYADAEPLLRRGLEIREAKLGKEHADVARTLVNLAAWHEKTDHPADAEPLYRRAVKTFESKLGKDHDETERAIASLASLLTGIGRHEEAEPFLRRRLAIREAKVGKDHLDTAAALQSLGWCCFSTSNHADAETVFRRAMEIREAKLGRNHADTASSVFGLGNAVRGHGRYQEAEPLYRRALEIREGALGKDHPQTAEALRGLAGLCLETARYDEADRLARRSLEVLETKQDKDSLDTAWSLGTLAGVCHALDRFSEAEPLYRRSLEIREAKLGKDHPHTAATLSNLGRLYFNMGRYGEAEPLYQRSLQIREARLGKEHPDVATSLSQVGTLYRKLGRYGEAEPLQRRSLAIREAKLGKDHRSVAWVLNDLGFLYEHMGRTAEAEPLYRRALEIVEAQLGKDHPDTAISLGFLANLLHKTGRDTEAEPLQRRCLEIREAKLGKNHFLTGWAVADLAQLYVKTGRQAEAEALYRRSLTIRETALGKDHPDVVWTLAPLIALYRSMGRYAEAEPLAIRAVEIHQGKFGQDNPDTASSLSTLAKLHAETGRSAESRAKFDESRRATRRYITTLLPTLSQPEQHSYLETRYVPEWSAALSLGVKLGAADTVLAEASAAWLANGKGVQQEARALAVQLQSSDDPATRPLAQQLQKVRQTLGKLKLEPAKSGLEAERTKQVDLLESQDRELTAQLQKLGGRTARGKDWTELPAIRAALPARAVLIDVARFEVSEFKKRTAADANEKEKPPEVHYVAWVTPQRGAVRVIDLGEAAAIDTLVAEVRKELTSSVKVLREKGEIDAEKSLQAKTRALAAKVLVPLLAVEEVKSAEQWVLSPDGNLWLAPWAALPLAGGEYVVEKYRLRTVTAGRDVAVAADRAAALKITPPVIVADPDYDLKRDAAARKIRELGAATPGDEQTRSVLSDGLRLGSVPRLPSTADEADLIAPRIEQLAQERPRVYAADQALEAVVKSTRHPRMLVLSTHGFFLPQQEAKRGENAGPVGEEGDSRAAVLTKEGKLFEDPLLRCGLLLAACNDQPRAGETRPGDDGVLTGLEVVAMDLRGCELVVLSACETGLGDIRNGEGVAGLRQAFQLAGAESVLASLWQVPDRETARLMAGFFNNLAAGKDRSTALAEAQRDLIRRRRDRHDAAHPFFWAAFTLTGQDQEAR